METNTLEIVGRDEELVAVESFLHASDLLPGALLLEGEAGIGKTTLWAAGLRAASSHGYRVLACTPSSSETRLSFAALRDLVDDTFEEVESQLPAPQRRALAVALLRESPKANPPQHGAIAVGFLSAIRRLAGAQPLLVAVDDVQWLDAPSAGVLEFAVRRLSEEPIGLLLAQRAARDAPLPLGLDRALPDGRLRRIRVGPLSVGAIHRMLRERLGSSLPRPTLLHLHEASRGNPFYAMELARALERQGRELDLGRPLPVPPSLHELVRERLAALSPEAVRALLAAALVSEPTTTIVGAVTEAEAWEAEACAAGVVELDGERIRFTHPLLPSVLSAQAADRERRELHRRLAGLVSSLEEQARQLALGTDAPDSGAARLIEEAARGAVARGAPDSGGELAEHARRLTPEPEWEAAHRRGLLAAESHWHAGDYERGKRILEELVEGASENAARAEALFMLAQNPPNLEEAISRCEAALAAAVGDAALQSDILIFLAQAEFGGRGDMVSAIGHAEAAAARAKYAADPRREAAALAFQTQLEGLSGQGYSLEALERAAEPVADSDDGPTLGSAHLWLTKVLLWLDELDSARERVLALDALAEEAGDIGRIDLQIQLARIEHRAGAWELGGSYVDRANELAEQMGIGSWLAETVALQALLDASLGSVVAARKGAERSRELNEAASDRWGLLRPLSVLGFLELSVGEPRAALEHFEPALEIAAAAGIRDACFLMWIPDAIEAYVETGGLSRAEALTAELEEQARAHRRPRLLAMSGRCRGLIQAARGDLDPALASLELAVAQHERLPVPFERGRTLLALGRVQRRAKQRRAARETLEQALAIFEELSARLWAEQARAELARIGGRAPSGGLTPTERRVAELVAEGRSNKEVAAALFVTVKTVEANLSRIYAKLGIRSRAELARRLAGEEQPAKL